MSLLFTILSISINKTFLEGGLKMKLNLKKVTQGFTIIEVLIVLAIAGLILLIVFLAVPALQRNSRNTQYRSESARILIVTQEFINNNNGTQIGRATCRERV